MGAFRQQSKNSTETDTVTDTEGRYKSRADSSAPASTSITNRRSSMPLRSILILALGSLLKLLLLITSADASPVFVDNPSLAQFQSGRNIRHLPCIVRKSGRSGVCMFAIDCIKQNGTHLGTCIDRFYFGSCCALKATSLFAPEINDNSIDQNTISHFAHESTTLRTTDSIFGGNNHSSNHQQHMASELLKNVTQSYLSSAKPVRTTSSSSSTTTMISSSSSSSSSSTSASTTRRPANAHTTHKNSHFVVRTTLKPSAAPTLQPTLKPLRRRTTTQRPVLTTLPAFEQRIETTTVPSKFVTFQIVETTTPAITEATNRWPETTTRRPSSSSSSAAAAAKTTSRTTTTTTTTTAAPTTTTTTTTTARPTPPLRTTTTAKPHKQQSSRRPVPPKKPTTTSSNSTTTTATRKPIESSSKLGNNTTTTASTSHGPTKTTTTGSSSHKTTPTTAATATRTTTKPERTTHAPRPKPQPTAEIVKVPALLADVPIATTSTAAATTTKATRRPTTTAGSSSTATTTAPKKQPISSTTTTTTPKPTRRHTTKTTAATTTATSSTTAAPTTRTTTTTRRTTTTTTAATPHTTETTKLPSPATAETATATATSSGGSSTKKPGLITWTDVEEEPITNATIASNWQPGQPADWIPMPTLLPEMYNKTQVAGAGNSSTDKVIISVATSVSTSSESKPGQSQTPMPTATTASKPHRTTKPPTAATTSKPAATTASSSPTTPRTTTTTTTPRTTTTTTAATVTSKTTTAASATESSIELASSTTSSTESSNELPSSSSSSTTDYSGEELNTTTIDAVGNITAAPASGLEGVDYREVCGRRMFPEPRIVGGANAAFGRWPWQISLRQWRTSTYLHKCGAALLNENWAITAAHCVDNVPPSDLLLRLGEYDLAEEEEPYGFQERRVQIVASHPQFDPRTFEYDLALLRFYEPVVFQPNIIPVCVPDNDENFIGQTAFVTGWGRLYEDGPLPSVLQEVAVPVINNTICESMYRSAGYIEHIPHIFICAGWKKGGYDSCEGDSGGPMVLQRESDKRFQLGGVISWGIGCAEANQPGVYTRISEFRDWINQILQF
ncbi:hypothetical protein KR044_011413 [Drosophila immigrans]|nr:hypothetical protein KR044_011413 [Drosophila immigrans]